MINNLKNKSSNNISFYASNEVTLTLQGENIFSQMSNAVRFLAADSIANAHSGHLGISLGMADVATVLFKDFLKFDPLNPDWPNRDRFVLSAGHGSALLYSLLYLTGYKDVSLDELRNFRKLKSKTPGHPEYRLAHGIETTTGLSGQGVANGVGMALGEAIYRAKVGADIIDHYTYVIAGDGCLMEGVTQEAISLAGHLKLKKLIVLFDENATTVSGKLNISNSEDQKKRFEAAGWNVISINGHSYEEIYNAFQKAQSSTRPTLIACKTVIGYGLPIEFRTYNLHKGSLLTDMEIESLRFNLQWPYSPFDVPKTVLENWRSVGAKGKLLYQKWQEKLENSSSKNKEMFNRMRDKNFGKEVQSVLYDLKKQMLKNSKELATRHSSQVILNSISPLMPQLLGGSADLDESTGAWSPTMTPISHENYAGNYIHYGVREHAMGSIMNGLSLYDAALIPYGGTFLAFSDYMRPSIRLSAMMNQKVIYVFTHDSIAVGEDGPTHQPIEHLMSLRLIPNLYVFRPADNIETAECWELALMGGHPSVMSLSRQAVFQVRKDYNKNLSADGGYILSPAEGICDVTLIASGSEVGLALQVKELLKQYRLSVSVVSMPCVELFAQQPKDKQESILGSAPRVVIEAGITWGWEKYTKDRGLVIGIDEFGRSGSCEDLKEFFGFTSLKIGKRIIEHLELQKNQEAREINLDLLASINLQISVQVSSSTQTGELSPVSHVSFDSSKARLSSTKEHNRAPNLLKNQTKFS